MGPASLPTPVLLFFLPTLLSLCGLVHCSDSCVQTLPNASDVQALAMDNQNQLVAPLMELRIFPNITFKCSGRIVGSRSAAISDTRGGRPELSVWRSDGNDTYFKMNASNINSCVISDNVTTLDTATVMIHQNSIDTPIPFEPGYVLGILFRPRPEYVPLLYNNTSSGDDEGLVSFYRRTQGSRANDVITLTSGRNMDTFLPLISLEICVSNSSCSIPRPTCLTPTSSTSSSSPTSSPTASSSSSPTSSLSPNEPLSSQTLIIAIAVPIGVVIMVLLLAVIVTLLCCMCRNRQPSKHSNNCTEEIPMYHVVENGGSVMHNNTLSSSGDVERKTSFLVSLNNDLYDLPTRREVAAYEEPVVSLSQYETIGDGEQGHTYATLLPPPNGNPSPNVLSVPTSPAFYHALEKSNSSTTPPGMSRTHSPRDSPSPKFSTKLSELSKPRKKGVLNVPPRLKLGSGLSQLEANVDSGVYVPTQPVSYDTPSVKASLKSQGLSLPSLTFVVPIAVQPLKWVRVVSVPVVAIKEEQRSQFRFEPVLFDDTIYSCLSEAPYSPLVHNWSFFEEAEIYWKPASDPSGLYAQLASMKYREILKNQIHITEHLGSGEFGTVCKGEWHTTMGTLDVAVKMLNNKATERDIVRFLQEAAIMGQFRHPNIVRLHGVVTVGEPVMIVLELMKNGDLRNYLKSLRPVPGEMTPPQLPQRLLDFSSQIALGMEYLARKEFVHRDLAARNILLTEDYICKIADFGMSRDLDDDDYYISHGGKIPIKWTSPEALHYRKYSASSDVWSFGVLMYEIWSLGHSPFKHQSPEDTIKLVDGGYRLPPPPGCPRTIYDFMIDCWHPDPSSRPTFTNVVQALSQSDLALLRWEAEDVKSHPQAAVLGAPMEAGEHLYPELQKAYIVFDNDSDY